MLRGLSVHLISLVWTRGVLKNVEGLRNFRGFSQPPDCWDEAIETRKKSSIVFVKYFWDGAVRRVSDLLPMWSGFDTKTPRHMHVVWVCFWLSSLLQKIFLRVLHFNLLPQKFKVRSLHFSAFPNFSPFWTRNLYSDKSFHIVANPSLGACHGWEACEPLWPSELYR